jgi:hypothetical protein
MLVDFVYFVLLVGGLQLPEYWRSLPGGGFIIAFAAPFFWVLCFGVGFTYPLARGQPYRPIKMSLRVITVLLVAFAVDFLLYRHAHPTEALDVSFRSILYVFVVPSAVITFFSALGGATIRKSTQEAKRHESSVDRRVDR